MIQLLRMKLEHIGIAVHRLDTAEPLFAKLLHTAPYKRESVASEGVNTSFFQVGESKVELLESSVENGVIARFLSKREEGIHHLAFEVEDIVAEMERLRAEGFRLLNESPKRGADNKWVCFVHPKDAGGVLIELCQEIKE